MKRKPKIVQFSLWKEAVPRRLARDACTQVKAGGRGVLVFLQLACCDWGLAQEGIFRMVQRMEVEWGEERRRWAGSVSRPLSQSGLQGRVQDVIVVAVAVGVAVVALGAGVVGCLLQPHQHIHQRVSFSVTRGHLLAR